MNKLRYIFLSLLLINYSSFRAIAQKTLLDTLQDKIATLKEDTSKVNALNKTVEKLLDKGDTMTANQSANSALSLSKRLQYKIGEAKARQNLAMVSFYKGKYAEAMEHSTEALKLFKERNYLSGMNEAYLSIGTIYQVQYKYDDARKYYTLSLEVAQASGEKKGLAQTYFWIGSLETWLENFPAALRNYFLALKLDEEIDDKNGMASIYRDIGYVYYNMGNYEDAFKNHSLSRRLFDDLGNAFGQASCTKNLGDVYIKLGNYKEALKNETKALLFFEQAGFDSWSASAHSSIGLIYEELGDSLTKAGIPSAAREKYEEALRQYQIAHQLNEKTQFNVYESSLKLGNLYAKLNNFIQARNFLDKSLQLSTELRLRIDIGNAYNGLSRLDSLQGNFSGAYANYKKYILYRDSIRNEVNAKSATQTRLEYEFEKKEAITKIEQDRKSADEKRIRNLQYFAIALVLLIASFLYMSNRQKQRAKTKIENAYAELKAAQAQLIQSEKMASLGELTAGIAHEIQNPLNFVNNFSEVNKELLIELKEGPIERLPLDAKTEAIEILNDLVSNFEKITHHGKRADGIVKSMLQHSHSSNALKEPTDINILAEEYLRLAYHGLRAKDRSFDATIKTDFDTHLSKINIVPQEVGRVLLNLFNNAFYAVAEKKKQSTGEYEPTVSVSTGKINEKIFIKVTDNGTGIPQKIADKIFQPFFTTKPTGLGTGLGLSLSYDIIKALSGDLKVETKEGQFAIFTIELPVK